jgi:hypothetical protein
MSPDLRFDPERLRVALATVPSGAWSAPSTFAATGVHHGYRRVTLVDHGNRWPAAEPFGFVLEALAPVQDAWLSWIDAGGFIVPHRDAGPWWERWQVPVSTSGVWLDSGMSSASDGVPFQVKHWAEHAVLNDADHPRIHVVVDRAVRIPEPSQPFALFPPPPQMVAFIDRSRSVPSTSA